MAKVFPLTRGVILEHGVVWVGDGATLLWFEGLRVLKWLGACDGVLLDWADCLLSQVGGDWRSGVRDQTQRDRHKNGQRDRRTHTHTCAHTRTHTHTHTDIQV